MAQCYLDRPLAGGQERSDDGPRLASAQDNPQRPPSQPWRPPGLASVVRLQAHGQATPGLSFFMSKMWGDQLM